MIENIDAVNNLDDILKVEGLDAILIGPYDLSASMGLMAKFEDSSYIDVINIINSKAQSAKIPCGVHVVNPLVNELQQKINNGYRFIAYSIDSVFININSVNPIKNMDSK